MWKRVKDRGTFENREMKVELSPSTGVLDERGLSRGFGVIRAPKETLNKWSGADLCFSLKASIARCKSQRLLRVGRFSVLKR